VLDIGCGGGQLGAVLREKECVVDGIDVSLERLVFRKDYNMVWEGDIESFEFNQHLGNYDIVVFTNLTPEHIEAHGGFKNYRTDDLAVDVIKHLSSQVPELDTTKVDDVIVGCANPEGEQGYNMGRLLTFLGDLPDTVPGTTINRLCGSSMQAILSAAAHIEVGWGECILVGGVESMSRVQRRGFNWSPSPELEIKFPDAYMGMGITAENVAREWQQTRIEHEEFALSSHQKAAIAQSNG
jgi:acetyl-CoA acyltransferase